MGKCSVEPSGSPFNSLVQLEYEQGIPAIHLSMQEHWLLLIFS
jgi:glutaminase